MASQSQPDLIPVSPEEVLDGRDSLRLVKFRLALTLIAAALLPIAAVAPIARAVLDDTRAGLNERLSSEAEHAAAEIRRELADVTSELDGLAQSPDVAASLAAPAGNGDATPALAQIGTLMNRPSAAVSSAAIVDPGGVIHARAGDREEAFSGASTTGVHAFSVLPDATGQPRALEIAVAVPGKDTTAPLGSVVAVVPIQNLLAWASPDTSKSN